MNFYNELMIGLSIGLSIGIGGGYYYVTTWKDWYTNREQNYKLEMLASLKQTRKFLLDKVVDETHAANALIIKVSNGGGKLTDGENWYSSVVAESPETRSASMLSDWQNTPVEDSHKAVIRDLQRQGWLAIQTEDMQPGRLRTTYEALGFVAAVKIELYKDDYYYYYMSFPVRTNWDEFTLPKDQHLIKTTVFNLSKKYQVYSRLNILKYDKLH